MPENFEKPKKKEVSLEKKMEGKLKRDQQKMERAMLNAPHITKKETRKKASYEIPSLPDNIASVMESELSAEARHRNNESISPDYNDETLELIKRFGTNDIKAIEKKLADPEEYTEVIDQEDSSTLPTELSLYETGDEQHLAPQSMENKNHKDTSPYAGMVWKRVKNWLSRRDPDAHTALSNAELGSNYHPDWKKEQNKHDSTKSASWISSFLTQEKRKDRNHHRINDFIDEQHRLAVDREIYENIEAQELEQSAREYQENLKKERRIVNPEDNIAA